MPHQMDDLNMNPTGNEFSKEILPKKNSQRLPDLEFVLCLIKMLSINRTQSFLDKMKEAVLDLS